MEKLCSYLKQVGSLANATHKAGGGDIRIENRKLDWKKDGRTDAFNSSYKPGGGDKKVINTSYSKNFQQHFSE